MNVRRGCCCALLGALVLCGCGSSGAPSPHFARRAVERCLERRGARIQVPHSTVRRGSEGTITAFFQPWSANLYFGKDEGEAKDIEGDVHEAASFLDPQLADESIGHVGNVAFAVIADFSLVPLARANVEHCIRRS